MPVCITFSSFLKEIRLKALAGTGVCSSFHNSSFETELSNFITPNEQIRVDSMLAKIYVILIHLNLDNYFH